MKQSSVNSQDTISTEPYWYCLKLSVVFIWIPVILIMISQSVACSYPVGICKFINFSTLYNPVGKIFLYAALLVSCIFYLLEKRMVLTTLSLFVLSCIIISYHESNGFFFRAASLSAVLGAQFFAYAIHYFKPQFDVNKYRVHFGVQLIAASYTLAAIAKLNATGLGWADEGGLFSIQVMKNYSYLYFDTGSLSFLEHGKAVANSFIEHKELVNILLTGAVLLELFCFVAVVNNKVRVVYGFALLATHIGIDFAMGIGVGIISKPMVVFFINPLYFIYLIGKKVYSNFFVAHVMP